MSPSFFLSLRADVLVSERARELVLETGENRLTFRQLSPGLLSVLRILASVGKNEAQLQDLILQSGDFEDLARFAYYLERLDQRGMLARSISSGDTILMTLIPISRYFGFAPKPIDPDSHYVLCRFSHARRDERRIVVESPLAHGRILLHDSRGIAILHALAQPRRPTELSGLAPDLSTDVLALLLGSGMVRSVVDEGPALHGWEFHELVFHASSRMGRHDRPVGAVYPFATDLPSPPALEPAHAEAWLELDRPDLNRIEREDAPFLRVLETRRTVRDYGARPINIQQLGEFLYRTARVRLRHEMAVQTPRGMVLMDFAPRPYPNGGSLYELELYVAVNCCSGLTSGLYYYDPLRHALGLVSRMTDTVNQLLAHAVQSAGIPGAKLQVLLVIAARFSRRSWKYTSTAYSNILKNAGVLYETMYLVATAMGLASSSLPDSSADLFAAAAGVDYYLQTSVGGFLLGSIRDEIPA